MDSVEDFASALQATHPYLSAEGAANAAMAVIDRLAQGIERGGNVVIIHDKGNEVSINVLDIVPLT